MTAVKGQATRALSAVLVAIAATRSLSNLEAFQNRNAMVATLAVLAEYPQKCLLDVSHDGKLLLVWAVSTPVGLFRIPWGGSGVSNQPSGDQLIILDQAGGKVRATTPIESFPRNAFLLPDSSGALFEQFGSKYGSQRLFWSLADNQINEFCPKEPIPGGLLFPMRNGFMVGYSRDLATRKSTLIKVSRESCTSSATAPADDDDAQAEIGFIDFAPSEDLFAYEIMVSRDGKRQFSGEISVRTTADLSVHQRLRAPTDLRFLKFTFSADSRFIAAGAITYRNSDSPDAKLKVLVYEVSSGKLLRSFNVDARNAIALSRDSKLLAVASKATRGENRRFVQAQVSIHDFQTGQKLAFGSYPWMEEPRNNPWVGDIQRMTFSPDGRKLLTTTYDTRIWRVPELDHFSRL
jgi:hypothetical protein